MSCSALVIGAGPAGLAAAIKLATWCDMVTVVEARPRERLRQAGEHLPPAGIASLADVGLEALLENAHHGESHGVRSVWGGNEPAERDYIFTLPGRGLNLSRKVFGKALLRMAEEHEVKLRFSTRLTALEKSESCFRATLRTSGGSRILQSDIVVDASGRHARAARLLGGKPDRTDQLVGVVGRVVDAGDLHEGGTLHIEAVENGWWYSVRCADDTRVCAYMTDAAFIRNYPGGPSALWRQRLKESCVVGPLAQDGRWTGWVEVFDAATQLLPDPGCDGFLAAGDAAMAFDPLSSAGIAKGVVDGIECAEVLERYQSGDPDALRNFCNKRDQVFRNYRSKHADIYRAERRWPQSSFWRARQGQPDNQDRRKELRSC